VKTAVVDGCCGVLQVVAGCCRLLQRHPQHHGDDAPRAKTFSKVSSQLTFQETVISKRLLGCRWNESWYIYQPMESFENAIPPSFTVIFDYKALLSELVDSNWYSPPIFGVLPVHTATHTAPHTATVMFKRL